MQNKARILFYGIVLFWLLPQEAASQDIFYAGIRVTPDCATLRVPWAFGVILGQHPDIQTIRVAPKILRESLETLCQGVLFEQFEQLLQIAIGSKTPALARRHLERELRQRATVLLWEIVDAAWAIEDARHPPRPFPAPFVGTTRIPSPRR